MKAQFELSPNSMRMIQAFDRTTRVTWLAAMAMIVQLVMTGCGGQQSGNVAPSAVDPDELYANSSYNTEDRDDDDEVTRSRRAVDEDEDETLDDGQTVDESQEEPPTRERPQDVTQWIAEDFKTALMEEDPDLPDAILHAGRASKGDGSIVAMLLGLLIIERPEGSGQSAEYVERDYRERDEEGSGPTEVPTEVVRAVIQALGLNGSPVALAAMQDMLNAKRQVPLDPRELVSEISRSLSQEVDSEKEKILLAMVTKPEEIVAKLSPESTGNGDEEEDGPRFAFRRSSELDPDTVLEEVLQEAGPSTSTAFRYNLAKFLDDPDVTAETAIQIEEFLSTDDRRNVPAQIILIQNEHTEPRTVEELQRTLTDGSRETLGQLFGIRGGTNEERRFGRSRDFNDDESQRRRRRSRSGGDAFGDEEPDGGPSVTPIDSESIVRYLWSPKVVSMLAKAAVNENRNASPETDDNSGGIPLLLSTIPSDVSRTALAKMFENRATEGSQPWTSMGMFGDDVADPAILVLAKAVYHESSSTSRRTRRRSDSDENESSSDWETTLETYVQNMCEQFNNSARTSAENEDMPLPFRLHRGANVVTRYHAKWPDQLDSQWSASQIAPLDLHYIRIEEEGRPRTIVSTYKRQTARGNEHDLSGGGLWLDEYNQRGQSSLDIRITSESGDLGLNTSRGERSSNRNTEDVLYTIEILHISIAPPDAKPAEKTAST